MHFARAVDLPSVIVYGGFSAPDRTGYDSFANVFKTINCGPCYLETSCPYDRECMKLIHSEDVLEAAKNMLNKPTGNRHWELSRI